MYSHLVLRRYLNDMYILELRQVSSQIVWDMPITFGQPPPPRESHSSVVYQQRASRRWHLFIYGGMNGARLGDLHMLDLDSMQWTRPLVSGNAPAPRSLHSATVLGSRCAFSLCTALRDAAQM